VPRRRVWHKGDWIMKKQRRLTSLELQVLRTIRKFAMLRGGEHLLVAASGGADSTALLLCLYDLAPHMNLRLTVAHLNHGIRGTEADEDADFIRRMSADLGLPFLSESADLRGRAAASRRNLEEVAREARYEFLRRTADRIGADKVATGHNLNDQAETILFRLLRGSGPGGLAGIHAVVDGRLIRPLIACSRQQILDFLAERKAAYREDSSNHDLHYQRNRIRHELIPYLETHFNPRLIETLAREADIAQTTYHFVESYAGREFEDLRILLNNGIALRPRQLLQLHTAVRRQVIRHALREVLGSLRGIETVHTGEVLRLCEPGQSGRSIELPGGILARRDLDWLELIRDARAAEPGFQYELAWPGRCRVPEAGLEFTASIEEHPEAAALPHSGAVDSARLDPEMLPATLAVRSRLPGDRYGGSGHRKVKKMLLAARISLPARTRLPVVAAGQAVIWVPGFKPARFFGAKPESSRCVLLKVEPAKSGDG
jgi:tRNA(Ile)-lysidine synthase